MSFVKIGEATHVVSGVTTLFELYEEAGVSGSESLKFTSTIREAGQIGRDILSWHLPTSVTLQATDTDRFLLKKFRDKAETDFRLDISKGGVLYNRVNLLLGSEQPQLGASNPVITIKGTDGILRLQSVNYDADTLEDTYPDGITVAELFQLLLDAVGHGIDTRVYLEVAHNNQDTTRPNAHGIRWAVRDWLEGEDSRTYYDVLGRLCAYYQLQVVQANGVWMVMERKYRGGPMDYANCAFGGSITKVAADDRQIAIGDSAIIRKSAKDPALQPTPKVVSRNVFPEKELLNPRFEEWNVGITEPVGWTIPSAATLTKFTHSTTGDLGATLNASADGFNQKSGETLGASERIRVVIEFIDVQYDAAFTSGTISAAVGQLVLTNTLDATDRYLQADGTWSTTPGTTINRTFEAGESTPITIVVEAIVPVAGTPELFTRFSPNPNVAGIDEFDSWTYGEFSYERLTPSSISRQIEYEAVSASESTEEIIEEEFAIGDFDNYNTGSGVSEYLDLTSAAWTKTTNWGSSTLFHQNRVTNRLQQQATRLRGLDIELAPDTEITIADTISRSEFRVTTGGDFRVTTTGDFRVTNTGDYIPVYEREDFWTRVRRFVAYEHKSDSANADRKYDPGPAPTARPNPTYTVEFALRSDGYYDVYFVAERDENTACIEWEYLVNSVVVDSGVEEFGTARTVRVQANPSNSLDLADVSPTLRAWGWSDYNAGNARGLRQARTFERTDLYNIFPEADYAVDFRWPLWLYSPTSTDRPELYDVWLTWRYNPQVRAIEYDFEKTGGGTRSGVIDLDDPGPFTAGSTDAPNFTFTADAGTDVITATAHGLYDGAFVVLSSSGTLPAGLSQTTAYYLRDTTTNTFKLAASVGGAAIDITDAGTGTHTANTRIIGWNISRNDTTRQVQPGDEITITAKAWSGISGGVGTGTEEPIGSRFSRKMIVPDLGVPTYVDGTGLQAANKPIAGKQPAGVMGDDAPVGSGLFIYDPNSTTNETVPGKFFRPDSIGAGSPGRYVRVGSHPAQYNVLDYGLDKTGVASATATVEAIVLDAAQGDRIHFPAGTYLFTDTDADGICVLIEDKKLSITGDFPGTVFRCDGELDILRKYSASNTATTRTQYPLFVEGIVFDCRNGAAGVVFYYDGVTDEYQEGEIRQSAFYLTGVASGGRDSVGVLSVRAREPFFDRIYMHGMRPDGTTSGSSLYCKPAPSGGITKTVRWKDSSDRWETATEVWDVDLVTGKTANDFVNGVGFYFTKTVGPSIDQLQCSNLAYGVWMDGKYGKNFTVTADSGTDAFTATAHTYDATDTVQFEVSGGSLPGGISADTTYYVRDVTANTFKVAAASGGAAIDLTTNGSGTIRSLATGNADRTASPFDAGLRMSNTEGIGCWNGYTMAYGDYGQIDASVIFDYCENPARIFGNDQGTVSGWCGYRHNQSRKAVSFAVKPYTWAFTEVAFDEVGFTSHLKVMAPNIMLEPPFSIGTFSSFSTAPVGHDLINLSDTTAFALWEGQVFKIRHGTGSAVDGGTFAVVEFTVFEDTAAASSSIKVVEGGSIGTITAGDLVVFGVAEYDGVIFDRMQHCDIIAPLVGNYDRDGVRYRDVIESMFIGGRIVPTPGQSGYDINWDYTGTWATDAGLAEATVKALNSTLKLYFIRHDNSVNVDDSGSNRADYITSAGGVGVVENIGGGYIVEDPSAGADDPAGFAIRINTFGAFARGFKVFDTSGLTYAGFFAKGESTGTPSFSEWYIAGNDASVVPDISTTSWIYGDMDGTERRVVIPLGNLAISKTILFTDQASPPAVTTNKLYTEAGVLKYDGAAVQTGAAGNAFANITDGTTTAAADSVADTFKLRSANSLLTIAVQNDDATHADNALFTLNESSINHDALTNFVANEHINHGSVSISAGTGLTGGGTIAANRTISIDVNATVTLAAIWTFDAGLQVNDNDHLIVGTGSDLLIFHDGTNTYFDNAVGTMYFRQQTNGGSINFVCDDGGGTGQAVANFSAASGLNITTGNLLIGGTKVVGSQGAAVADASGGATVDAEARTALNALLARLRTHGLIAT